MNGKIRYKDNGGGMERSEEEQGNI